MRFFEFNYAIHTQRQESETERSTTQEAQGDSISEVG